MSTSARPCLLEALQDHPLSALNLLTALSMTTVSLSEPITAIMLHTVFMTADRRARSSSTVKSTDNGGYGIHGYSAYGDHNAAIYRYNQLWDNQMYGINGESSHILATAGSGHQVYGNVMWSTSTSAGPQSDKLNGITTGVGSSSGTLIYNNTIYNTPRSGIQIFPSASGTIVTNNIVVGSNQNSAGFSNIDDIGSSSPSFTTNLCNGSGGTSHCAYTTNPLFVNPPTDFHISSATSQAVNNGTNLGSTYSPDIAGVARPTSGPWEIGAYEFVPTATCPSTSPALVAAYSFDNVSTDASGNANTAILGTGVTYTPSGKYGQGLTFNGAGGVTVADNNSLDFCNGFTLEAWINVPSVSSDSMFIVKNPNSTYFLGQLAGFTPLGVVPAGGFGGSGSPVIAFHGLQLTPSTLTHLAVTYDGITVSLYKNGAAVSTAAGGASIAATTGNLQFCDSGFGELCPSGTVLDEVKLYNYARSPAQIVTDMNTPITPTPEYCFATEQHQFENRAECYFKIWSAVKLTGKLQILQLQKIIAEQSMAALMRDEMVKEYARIKTNYDKLLAEIDAKSNGKKE